MTQMFVKVINNGTMIAMLSPPSAGPKYAYIESSPLSKAALKKNIFW
jgi:hypothetical protein